MASKSPAGPVEVLVVEDNPGDVHLLEEALETSAFECSYSVVNDGEEALDFLHQRNDHASVTRPDLVFLDLNVPRVSGRDVLAEIRSGADTEPIPVVVLSGSESPDDVRETYELGANGYFTKPVDPSEFISLVQSVGEALATSGQLPRGEFANVEQDS